MKIALVSLDQAWENKIKNLEFCEKYIKMASGSGADLIIFPEMTLTGFSNNVVNIAEDYRTSKTILDFSILAKKFSIGIIFGAVVRSGERALNKSFLVDRCGMILADYAKVHPFSFSGENNFFGSGSKLSVIKYEDMRIGLTICYDLRFPELYSVLGRQCDLIINIANWPLRRIDHWNTLLKARAIENQVFVVGVNRVGVDGNGLEYAESSGIFNANGEKLDFEQVDDMKMYEVNKEWTSEFKDKFNTTSDRKIEFYKEIL